MTANQLDEKGVTYYDNNTYSIDYVWANDGMTRTARLADMIDAGLVDIDA
jgi:hypothetical protein